MAHLIDTGDDEQKKERFIIRRREKEGRRENGKIEQRAFGLNLTRLFLYEAVKHGEQSERSDIGNKQACRVGMHHEGEALFE
jgi:hypothetical protein